MPPHPLSLLKRREIEALVAVPLIRAYGRVLGPEKGLEIARKAIEDLAKKAGLELARELASNTIADFSRVVRDIWARDGALEISILEETETTLAFHVTRCRYVESYDRLGVKEFGYCLSCARDEAFARGFNPGLKLTRTQTIMEGAPHCDFHFQMR